MIQGQEDSPLTTYFVNLTGFSSKFKQLNSEWFYCTVDGLICDAIDVIVHSLKQHRIVVITHVAMYMCGYICGDLVIDRLIDQSYK